jgi:NAD+ kinase
VATVALVPHQTRKVAADIAVELATWLEGDGHRVRVPAYDAKLTGLQRWSVDEERLTDGLDLAVSLGGDGTMLRTVHMVAAASVPVLGVNVGHLGYLTEVEPAGTRAAVERWLTGDYFIERRMTLAVEVSRAGEQISTHVALNEAVLQRSGAGHTVRVATWIDDNPFVTYVADGLIVSTPTGSTAYNLSARGPIVSPNHRALIVTPVSPHMLFNHSLVLDGGEIIRLEQEDGRPADLVVDGQLIASVGEGDSVLCTAGPHDAHLVSFQARDFHHLIKTKLGLGGL